MERYRSGHNGAVLKTVRVFGSQGFESLPLRQLFYKENIRIDGEETSSDHCYEVFQYKPNGHFYLMEKYSSG